MVDNWVFAFLKHYHFLNEIVPRFWTFLFGTNCLHSHVAHVMEDVIESPEHSKLTVAEWKWVVIAGRWRETEREREGQTETDRDREERRKREGERETEI